MKSSIFMARSWQFSPHESALGEVLLIFLSILLKTESLVSSDTKHKLNKEYSGQKSTI